MKTNIKELTHYIFELGMLKKVKHCGVMYAGVPNPDTVAEHAHRAAIIGYLLATMENANPEKTALICLLHDNAETRISDFHKIAVRYINPHKGEMKAIGEQCARLPKYLAKKFISLFKEYESGKTLEGRLARDANYLELAFQAKEYVETGHKACEDWLINIEKALKTPSAKKIFKEMRKIGFTDWWQGLKNLKDHHGE